MKKYKEYHICKGQSWLEPVYDKPLFVSLQKNNIVSCNFINDVSKATRFRYYESLSVLRELKETKGFNDLYMCPVVDYDTLD